MSAIEVEKASESSPESTGWLQQARPYLVWSFRGLVLLLVAGAIAWTLRSAEAEFSTANFPWQQVRWPLLAVAGGLYLLGSLPSALFWWLALRALGQRPELLETIRAFYIGHLGKYVPGKAMVVVIRSDLVQSDRVDPTAAGVSVFVETLTLMAVGAFLAGALLLFYFRDQLLLQGVAWGLLAVAGLPTLPPVFRRLVLWTQASRLNPELERNLDGLDFRLLATGWLLAATSWLLLGLSFWATLAALPPTLFEVAEPMVRLNAPLEALPIATAAVALAMVAGFLSLIPGGAGVRETVLTTLLAGMVGPVAAILAALLLRVVWLLAELLAAGALYFTPSPRSADHG